MNKTVLFLSHWDASIPVRVPENVVKDLQNYHVMGVRFLYDCFRKGQRGAVLNHENGMNPQIQVSAFFNALNNFITPRSPILVVCCEERIKTWHYHLTRHGGYDVTLLSPNNYEEILQGKFHRVVLSTVDNVKLLREIKETDFLSVAVDDLDEVATKNVIKQLKSQFNIGLTYRNFLKNPDQKLFWTMLNWSNPGILAKFTEFCSEDDDHLVNLRYPYGAWWQRLTWKFCDSFKRPTEEEEEQYRTALQNWSRSHGAYHVDLLKPVKRQTRKRTAKSDPVKEEPNLKQEEDEADDLPKAEVKRQTRKRAVKSEFKVKQEDEEPLVELPKLQTKRQTRKRAAKSEPSPKREEDKNDSSDDLPDLRTRRLTRKRAVTSEPSPKQEEDKNDSSDDLPEIITRRQTRKRQVKSVEVPDVKQRKDFRNSDVAEPEIKRQTRRRKGESDSCKDVQNMNKNEINKTKCSTSSCLSSPPKTSKNTGKSQDLNSSQDTVTYDFKDSPPSDDDVLSSIMTDSNFKSIDGSSEKASKNTKNSQNLNSSEDTIIYDLKDNTDDDLESSKEKVLAMLNDESNDTDMNDSDDDVLMSIMGTKSIKKETKSQTSSQYTLNSSQPKSKESEILSLLYGDME